MGFKDRVQEYIIEELDAHVSREGTVSRHPLDISIKNGTPFSVAKDSVTTVHKSPKYALDEVYLYASNRGATDTFLTMSFQDSGDAIPDLDTSDDIIIVPVKSRVGLSLVLPGNPVSGKTLYVQASHASSVNILGYVFRYYRNHEFDDNKGFHHGEG
tara:strand:+ start:112 stop:582 length:471 start_codon:yes stop_codon:yes gene_type:complete